MFGIKLIALLLLIRNSLSEESCKVSSIVKLSNHKTEYNIRFPNIHTSQDDEYKCTGLNLGNSSDAIFIKSFEPEIKANRVHHMLVFGCEDEIVENEIWKCKEKVNKLVCPGKSKIVYAWSRNTKAMKLPKNVGFGIGSNFNVKSLVIQIHYKYPMKKGETDCSGFSLVTTDTKPNFYVGLILLGSKDLLIPARKHGYGIASCKNNIKAKLNVFAHRAHTHTLGKVVTGYRIRGNETKMVGKADPIGMPENFFPREGGTIDLQYGDKLIARCDYVSDRDVDTVWGENGTDEMCRFYMMYYTTNKQVTVKGHTCWKNELPSEIFPLSASQLTPYPGYAGNDLFI